MIHPAVIGAVAAAPAGQVFDELFHGSDIVQSGGLVTSWTGRVAGISVAPNQGDVDYVAATGGLIAGAHFEALSLTDGVDTFSRLVGDATINGGAAPTGRTVLLVYDLTSRFLKPQANGEFRQYIYTTALGDDVGDTDHDLTIFSDPDKGDPNPGSSSLAHYRPSLLTSIGGEGGIDWGTENEHRAWGSIDANHGQPWSKAGLQIVSFAYDADGGSLYRDGMLVGVSSDPCVVRAIDGVMVFGSVNAVTATAKQTRFDGTLYMVGIIETKLDDAANIALHNWAITETGASIPQYQLRRPIDGTQRTSVYFLGEAAPASGSFTELRVPLQGVLTPGTTPPTNTAGVPTFEANNRITTSSQVANLISTTAYDIAIVLNVITLPTGGASAHIIGTQSSSNWDLRIVDVSGTARIQVRHVSTNTFVTSSVSITTGVHLLRVKYDGDVITVQVDDGTPETSSSSFPNTGSLATATTIGASNDAGSNQFLGEIRGWHFHNAILSSQSDAERSAWLESEFGVST